MSRHWSSYQLKASAARYKKATKVVGTNSHAICKVAPPFAGTKIGEIISLKPLEPPYPRSYDPNAKYNYHGGAVGHATERLNVQNNPLPAHRGMAINAISQENRDESEGASRREREECAAGCTTDSVSRVEEGAHSSRLNETKSASIAYPIGETTKPLAIKEDPILEVTNIAGIGGVTRSERIFAPKNLRNKDPVHVKKDKATKAPRRIMMEGEATEFLKLICHSEYEMLDQLYKTLACISLLFSLINSEGHRNLL
ncbi:hypothetical protein CR513_46669, partial [Mucuna pruriens]